MGATYDPRAILVLLVTPPEEKKWMNIMCTFARVEVVARDKNHNSFSGRGGKNNILLF